MEKNIPNALLESAEKRWKKTGPIYFGRKFKYKNVITEVKKYAAMFMSMGVDPGDRVATMMTNVPQTIFSNYGTSLAGGIVCPINILSLPQNYKPKSNLKIPEEIINQIKYQIQDSKPRVLVALDIFYPIIAQIQDELKKIHTQVILTRIQDYLPRVPIIAQHKYRQKAEEKKIWVEKKDIPFDADFTNDWFSFFGKKKSAFDKLAWKDFPGVNSKPNDTTVLLYTAGTEGMPKGVELTHYNLLSNIRQCREHMDKWIKDEHTSMLGLLPFFHVFGMTTGMNIPLLSIGAPMVLVPDSKDLEYWVGSVKKYKLKAMSTVSRVFERLIHHPHLVTGENFRSVELFIHGAGELKKITREEFEKLLGGLITIFEGYGKTETSPAVSVCTPDDFKPGSAGKPLPDTEIKIINLDTGKEVPAGTKGEILVKGPQVAKGYWKKPKETAEAFKNGWHHTEDIGYIDKDGHLFITDRISDMIKVLGEKVFPTQVEEKFPSHPYIEKLRIVGVADDRLAAIIMLSKEGKKNKKTAKKEILDFAKQNLPKYEVPREIFILPDLDKYTNALGKPLRKKIRKDIKNGSLK